MSAAHQAVLLGYGTVVLQAGEDPGLTMAGIADMVSRIKQETPLAVTLSLGERAHEELAAWRNAGVDRYLLRFETSDRRLFQTIHPGLHGRPSDRTAILRQLRDLGYEVGSGIMVGLPRQSLESIARDIELFRELDLDMIGIGPYLPHPNTPLGAGQLPLPQLTSRRLPDVELLVYKTLALTRLVRPDANIPSTTALATINKRNGRELGLQRGANVFMPNLTPLKYRRLYQIYPAKACIDETGDACNGCLRGRIARLGRHVGLGQGGRRKPLVPTPPYPRTTVPEPRHSPHALTCERRSP
jgi:biotin synthase